MSDDGAQPRSGSDAGRHQRIPAPAERAVWSGRAEVPPRRPERLESSVDWYEEVDRRWWMPIVVGLVALLVLGALGLALGVIL